MRNKHKEGVGLSLLGTDAAAAAAAAARAGGSAAFQAAADRGSDRKEWSD